MGLENERLWQSAFATWVVGDVVTTAVGLSMSGVVESNPTGREVLSTAGYGGMLAWKLATTGAFVGLQSMIPEEWEKGVPIGLALLGTGVTLNNISVILRA